MKRTDYSITDITLDFLKSHPLPQYSPEADKTMRGRLLVVAGSRHIPGAAVLTARAALRSGCGGVRLAAPESIATAIGIAIPELMVIPLPEQASGTIASRSSDLILEQAAHCSAAVFGPGLGSEPDTEQLLHHLASSFPLPTVLDASALRAWGKIESSFSAPRILTPHSAEMGELTALSEDKVEAQRQEIALQAAQTAQAVVALKGRETLIANPEGTLHKNTVGTCGLGTAGSGDVLAGLIGGLLAQMPEDPTRAALWGVHLHALAGEACEKELGDDAMAASDIITCLPGVLRYARKQTDRQSTTHRTGLRPA